ncbi:hypothetical protein GOP47_0001363 [Adiantum capillus-veneris]|uniref:Uncharacterized protein n=1 Tax=Adiantum capillus-veneris TaxID=13818 RepID=A0A9D4V8X1_ADICA|nr:hypothetical protein GOP47_0001363 [Adiantum capillus-veneris]
MEEEPPPPPPLPPQRGFGVGKTLLTLGGGILLLILSRAQRDLRSLSGSIKEAVEESKAGLSLAERAVISMEEEVATRRFTISEFRGDPKKEAVRFWLLYRPKRKCLYR